MMIPADKDNVTVIMKTLDYDTKIRELLEPATYRKLNKDPAQAKHRNINKVLFAFYQ